MRKRKKIAGTAVVASLITNIAQAQAGFFPPTPPPPPESTAGTSITHEITPPQPNTTLSTQEVASPQANTTLSTQEVTPSQANTTLPAEEVTSTTSGTTLVEQDNTKTTLKSVMQNVTTTLGDLLSTTADRLSSIPTTAISIATSAPKIITTVTRLTLATTTTPLLVGEQPSEPDTSEAPSPGMIALYVIVGVGAFSLAAFGLTWAFKRWKNDRVLPVADNLGAEDTTSYGWMIENTLHKSIQADKNGPPGVILDENLPGSLVTPYVDLVGGTRYAVVDTQGYQVPVGAYAALVGGRKYAGVDSHEYERLDAGAYVGLAGGSKYVDGRHGTFPEDLEVYAVPMDKDDDDYDYSSGYKSHA